MKCANCSAENKLFVTGKDVTLCGDCARSFAEAVKDVVVRNFPESAKRRYEWEVSMKGGGVLKQYDNGVERSISIVDFDAATELRLNPQFPGYPPIRAVIKDGEFRKFWQGTANAGNGQLAEFREVVAVRPLAGQEVFVLFGMKGDITVATSPDV